MPWSAEPALVPESRRWEASAGWASVSAPIWRFSLSRFAGLGTGAGQVTAGDDRGEAQETLGQLLGIEGFVGIDEPCVDERACPARDQLRQIPGRGLVEVAEHLPYTCR